MPANKRIVTGHVDSPSLRGYESFVLMVGYLEKTGVWSEISRELRLHRWGFQGIDVVTALLAYWCFSDRGRISLKVFLKRAAPFSEALGAVAGRKRLPTQASLSRALRKVNLDQAEAFGAWLLQRLATLGKPLLQHPAVGRSDGTRLIHLDGMHHALRQRSLTEGEELPPPRRQLVQLAAPGFPGRKRGEVVMDLNMVQDVTTGLWSGLSISRGSGQLSRESRKLLPMTQSWVRILGEEPSKTLVVMDGEGGGRGQVKAAAATDLALLTRLSCYDLLTQPELRDHLREVSWHPVPDQQTGPRRYAIDAGTITLRGVPLRLVISRFETEEKRGAGCVIDGWQYEIFGVLERETLPLSAVELVREYHGRAALENHFLRLHKEFSKPQVFCTAPGGQYLAYLMALVVWNLETLLGAMLHPDAHLVPAKQEIRHRIQPVALPKIPALEEPPERKDVLIVSDEEVRKLLEAVDWNAPKYEDWSYNAEDCTLTCPQGKVLTWHSIRYREDCIEVSFRGLRSDCSDCPIRFECSNAKKRSFRKTKTIRLKPGPGTKTGSRYQWEPPPQETTDQTVTAGEREIRFVSSRLRESYRAQVRLISVFLTMGIDEKNEELPDILSDGSSRSRCRQTWWQHGQWNASTRPITIRFDVADRGLKERLDRLLLHPPTAEVAAEDRLTHWEQVTNP